MIIITPGMYLLGGFGIWEETDCFSSFNRSGFCHSYGVGMWMGCGAWWEVLGGQAIESPLILAQEGFRAKVKTACLGTCPAGSKAL